MRVVFCSVNGVPSSVSLLFPEFAVEIGRKLSCFSNLEEALVLPDVLSLELSRACVSELYRSSWGWLCAIFAISGKEALSFYVRFCHGMIEKGRFL